MNVAPTPVLATLPGLTSGAVGALLRQREASRPIETADQFGAVLSSSERDALYAHYTAFVLVAAFTSAQLVATVDGGVRGVPVTARMDLTVVPTPGRLAVIRRQAE